MKPSTLITPHLVNRNPSTCSVLYGCTMYHAYATDLHDDIITSPAAAADCFWVGNERAAFHEGS